MIKTLKGFMYFFRCICILCIAFFSQIELNASNLGDKIEFYDQVENLQKQNKIDLNKIENLKLDRALIKSNRKSIEKSIPYALDKRFELPSQNGIDTYVVVLNVYGKPSCVKFSFIKDKLVLIRISFSADYTFQDILEKLKPMLGSKPKIHSSTNINSAYWTKKYQLLQTSSSLGKRLKLWIEPEAR